MTNVSQQGPKVASSHQFSKRTRKKAAERGAELVEFAMVLIPMISLVFLSVDVAWAIYAKAALQEAVREGVRYGVTGQTVNTSTCLDQSVRDVVIQYSFGILNTANQTDISIAYYAPTNTGTALPTGQAGNTAGGNILQVSVSGVSLKLLAPFFVSTAPMTLSTSASDVIEGNPNPPCE